MATEAQRGTACIRRTRAALAAALPARKGGDLVETALNGIEVTDVYEQERIRGSKSLSKGT